MSEVCWGWGGLELRVSSACMTRSSCLMLKLLCLLFLTIPSFVPSDGAGPHHALPPRVQWLFLPGAERAADLCS